MSDPSTLDSPFLTRSELAKLLRCSERTLDRMLADGTAPRSIPLFARKRVFAVSDVDEWIKRRAERKGS
jgi:excisionase family DNA binding protein